MNLYKKMYEYLLNKIGEALKEDDIDKIKSILTETQKNAEEVLFNIEGFERN